MKIDELIKFCSDVRQALELANSEGVHDEQTSLGMSDFPTGCCGETTDLLAYLIYEQFGEIALHRSGTYMSYIKNDARLRDNNNHAWLELSGTIIDLTADQFNDRGFNNPAVMITQDKTFHALFSSRDGRYNPESATKPKLSHRLTRSFWYLQDKLRSSGWSL
ncbi:hypothetical protein [Silvania hatchlandensis]|uniref:Uncharacterized protein n=1 Tax=Silvania hatchlandensis TaxID=2926469 RepID=A0A9J6Q4V7_9ENTR|nr:hypothetical protein [Silvania hatchlandensis]MCU6666097.1 hypothetical protein [Silvania hatchlandensis]